MLKESTLIWQKEFIICKKMIKILIVDYQSEFASNLFSMLVDIESFTCPGRGYRLNKAFWEEGW